MMMMMMDDDCLSRVYGARDGIAFAPSDSTRPPPSFGVGSLTVHCSSAVFVFIGWEQGMDEEKGRQLRLRRQRREATGW